MLNWRGLHSRVLSGEISVSQRLRSRTLYLCVVGAALLLAAGSIVSARGLAGRPADLVYAAPTITGISPSAGPASGGTTVVITGTGFQQPGNAVLSVNFGITGAGSFTVDSATQITAT
nr:IPT/TIG domain-containing protein [Acidobacteriota bacterium]